MWADQELRARDRCWPHAERLLSSLPPGLFHETKLLEYDLALRYSDSGQFRTIFLGADHFPMLSLGSWLLDDLAVPPGAERDEAERRLFIVALLLVFRAQAIASILDPVRHSGDGRSALVQYCSEAVERELAALFPPGSDFWPRHAEGAVARLDGDILTGQLRAAPDPGAEPEAYLGSGWAGPARILALAALEVAGERDRSARLLDSLDRLAAALQIGEELSAMHRDLLNGSITFPIAFVTRAANIPLRPAPEPFRVLGALATSGSLAEILRSAETRLGNCRTTLAGLDLPLLESFVGEAHAQISRQLADEPVEREGSAQPAEARRPLIVVEQPALSSALVMARNFLLADQTFRESWELHREGMFGADEVASRYPAGLILEILAGHGVRLTEQVDAFLSFTAANLFRYYDHPWSDADSDTVGVFLRLVPHAGDGREWTAGLHSVLDCLAGQVAERGSVPVWLTGCAGDTAGRPPIVALGEECGTVAAHLLLGLTTDSLDDHRQTVEVGAADLLDRISDVGLGANVNYPPMYALAIFFRLLRRLEKHPARDLAASSVRAQHDLVVELERRRQARPTTAQAAALATIACRDAGRADLVEPAWRSIMLKSQRFDGGWPGEPFAPAPNRGGVVSWYASTMLTSALCFDALSHWSDA